MQIRQLSDHTPYLILYALVVILHSLFDVFSEKWIQCDSTMLIIPNESEDDEDELAGDDPDDQDYELSGNST